VVHLDTMAKVRTRRGECTRINSIHDKGYVVKKWGSHGYQGTIVC
jgi:hypothetical protein